MNTSDRRPGGTITFLFTDIEGSTERWERHRVEMQDAVRRHDALMRAAIRRHNGFIFKTVGDEFCVAFSSAANAMAAAVDAQRSIQKHEWSAVSGLRVRMAAHSGTASERDGDYFGPAVNRTARIMDAGHGGQILISASAAELARGELPEGTSLRVLGAHRLRGIEGSENLSELVAEDLPAVQLPLRTLESLTGNLPVQMTSFVGRGTETSEISALLQRARLVTIVGSGGIGKTRTALQVASALDADATGAWFVDLAPLSDPALIPGALASIFDVGGSGGDRTLIDDVVLKIKDRSVVLVFDNCEHVIAAAADVADRILRGCPHVRILATSRELLGIAGEEAYRMPPLSVPPSGARLTAAAAVAYESVRLFAERAFSVEKTFALTDDNAEVVANIARRLDGIALPIELAAARVRSFDVVDLDKRLAELFKVLTGGSRVALPRQQTLHAMIEWSYDLLEPAEASLLRHLAVFSGTFSLDAAERVCGPETDLLALVEKSLVVYEPAKEGRRYRLLESTRQFALQRLIEAGDAHEIYRRHCLFYRSKAERARDDMAQIALQPWLAQNIPELENYRGAISWGLLDQNDIESGAAIVSGLQYLYYISLRTEGRAMLSKAFEKMDSIKSSRLKAFLYMAEARLNLESGEAADAGAAAAEFFAGSGEAVWQAESLRLLASTLAHSGKQTQALEKLYEALALARAASHPMETFNLLMEMADVYVRTGELEKASAANEESMSIALARQDNRGMLFGLGTAAKIHFVRGEIEKAAAVSLEAVEIARNEGHERALALMQRDRGVYLLACGEYAEAWRCARECVDIAVSRQSPALIAGALEQLALLESMHGDDRRAAKLFGYSDALFATAGVSRDVVEYWVERKLRPILEGRLGAEALSALMAEGGRMEQGAAVEMAAAVPAPPAT